MISASILAAVSIFLCLHVFVTHNYIKTCTLSEIAHIGYPANEIRNIHIDHSYLRRMLGYNEWRISVEFEKEPNVFFWFTYKANRMIFQGVSSEPMMTQEAVILYSEKFKNGTLFQ